MAKKREEAKAAPKPIAVPAAAAPEAPPAPQPTKVDFDAWWAMNEKKLPLHHRKEVILADFRARGLSMKETMQSYNEALKKYGVKLK